jgi:hypothetical protein
LAGACGRAPAMEGKRLNEMMAYLYGTTTPDELEKKLVTMYPSADMALIKRVTRRIADYHLNGYGYSNEQIQRQLSRL